MGRSENLWYLKKSWYQFDIIYQLYQLYYEDPFDEDPFAIIYQLPSGNLLHSHGFSMALIEIDGFTALKNGDFFFHGKLLVITRWYIPSIIISHPLITIINQY